MLGHKRGQCSPAKETSLKAKLEEDGLETKMQALQITTAFHDEDEKKLRAARRRSSLRPPVAETVLSLSSDDKAVLDILATPGMMSDDPDQKDGELKKWLETVPVAKAGASQRRKSSRIPDVVKLEMPTKALEELVQLTLARKPSSLNRTYSVQRREEFMESLEEKLDRPKTIIVPISPEDIEAVKEEALKHKLHARIIRLISSKSAKEERDGWLVIGADRTTVEEVFERVKADEQKKRKGILPKTLASGALGAVATWIVMAYA